MNYCSSNEICNQLKITRTTLKNWRELGSIQFIKLSDKKFLYDINSIIKNDIEPRFNVIYSRVSNIKQEQDLRFQTQLITNYMVSNGIIPDFTFEEIASGMNENRTQFNKLIQLVIQKKVHRIYISYKDRLTRFGYGYFEQLFSLFGTDIIILNATKEEDFQQELIQDLISVIHHFSMKLYSNRRRELKNVVKKLQEKIETV